MEAHFKIPFSIKASIVFVGLYYAVSILYIAQDILIPLIYAVLISVLLRPYVNWLEKKRMHRVAAISIILTLSTLLFVSLGALIFFQATRFAESVPVFIDKLQELLNEFVNWISGYFNWSKGTIEDFINSAKADLLQNSSAYIGNTITSTGRILVMFILIPVYIFMILYYQPLLLNFVHKISGKTNLYTGEIFVKTKGVIQNYLKGLLIEAAIVAVLNSAGLLILGIEYAIFLGIIGALLNLIPYLGGIIAAAFYMMIALVTKDSPSYALWVLALYSLIQLIDNNYIVPKIVGSRVKINALITFIGVILGGALWNIHGMFLSIPIIAIIKVIFDRMDPLKPIGFLIGEKMPASPH